MFEDTRTFNLFVYGTLMSGFNGNRNYIPKDTPYEKGFIRGNLYHYIGGYPMIEIPSSPYCGSLDYNRDIEIQNHYEDSDLTKIPFHIGYGNVYGEFYKIPYSRRTMEGMDNYEGFTGSTNTFYSRDLVPIQLKDRIEYGWVYNIKKLPNNVCRILTGDWHDCFNEDGNLLEYLNNLFFMSQAENENRLDPDEVDWLY